MAEFERRFPHPCSGITDLQMKKTSLEQEISLLKTQTELLKTGTERLQDLSHEIEHRLTLWLPDWRSWREPSGGIANFAGPPNVLEIPSQGANCP
jgi:hypothetical protein